MTLEYFILSNKHRLEDFDWDELTRNKSISPEFIINHKFPWNESLLIERFKKSKWLTVMGLTREKQEEKSDEKSINKILKNEASKLSKKYILDNKDKIIEYITNNLDCKQLCSNRNIVCILDDILKLNGYLAQNFIYNMLTSDYISLDRFNKYINEVEKPSNHFNFIIHCISKRIVLRRTEFENICCGFERKDFDKQTLDCLHGMMLRFLDPDEGRWPSSRDDTIIYRMKNLDIRNGKMRFASYREVIKNIEMLCVEDIPINDKILFITTAVSEYRNYYHIEKHFINKYNNFDNTMCIDECIRYYVILNSKEWKRHFRDYSDCPSMLHKYICWYKRIPRFITFDIFKKLYCQEKKDRCDHIINYISKIKIKEKYMKHLIENDTKVLCTERFIEKNKDSLQYIPMYPKNITGDVSLKFIEETNIIEKTDKHELFSKVSDMSPELYKHINRKTARELCRNKNLTYTVLKYMTDMRLLDEKCFKLLSKNKFCNKSLCCRINLSKH